MSKVEKHNVLMDAGTVITGGFLAAGGGLVDKPDMSIQFRPFICPTCDNTHMEMVVRPHEQGKNDFDGPALFVLSATMTPDDALILSRFLIEPVHVEKKDLSDAS